VVITCAVMIVKEISKPTKIAGLPKQFVVARTEAGGLVTKPTHTLPARRW
jgi:hypothetical protein